MIPYATYSVKGMLRKPTVTGEQYEARREWADAYPVYVSIYPLSEESAPQETGMEPVTRVRLCFSIRPSQTVAVGDRVAVDGKTYQISSVLAYFGNVSAEAVLQ